jgi:hypothetical protein
MTMQKNYFLMFVTRELYKKLAIEYYNRFEHLKE